MALALALIEGMNLVFINDCVWQFSNITQIQTQLGMDFLWFLELLICLSSQGSCLASWFSTENTAWLPERWESPLGQGQLHEVTPLESFLIFFFLIMWQKNSPRIFAEDTAIISSFLTCFICQLRFFGKTNDRVGRERRCVFCFIAPGHEALVVHTGHLKRPLDKSKKAVPAPTNIASRACLMEANFTHG